MKKSRFSEEQIAFALRQLELRTSVDEVCSKMGVGKVRKTCATRKHAGRCCFVSMPDTLAPVAVSAGRSAA